MVLGGLTEAFGGDCDYCVEACDGAEVTGRNYQ